MVRNGAWTWTELKFAILGQACAKRNPSRWSKSMNLKDLMKDIQKCIRQSPRRVTIVFDGNTEEIYNNQAEAVQQLRDLIGQVDVVKPRPGRLSWVKPELEAEAVRSSSVLYDRTKSPTFHVSDLHTLTVRNDKVNSEMQFGLRLCLLDVPAVFVAFRGTVNCSDWVSNLKFSLGKPKDGEPYKAFKPFSNIHMGFWNDLVQNMDTIGDHLYKFAEKHQLLKKEWTLVLTGHSRGGALAQLLFMFLESSRERQSWPLKLAWLQNEIVNMYCMSFASPSVVCWTGATPEHVERFHWNIVNYVFRQDPFPRFYGWAALVKMLQDGQRLLASAARVAAGLVGAFAAQSILLFLTKFLPLLDCLVQGLSAIEGAQDLSQKLLQGLERLEEWLKPIQDRVQDFHHVGQVLYVQERDETASPNDWLCRFRIGDMNMSHHSIKNYVQSIEKQGTEFRIEHAQHLYRHVSLPMDDSLPMDELLRDVRQGNVVTATASVATDTAEERTQVAEGAALLAGFTLEAGSTSIDEIETTLKHQRSSTKMRQELQHQFLDAAKYGNFAQMFHMLEVTDKDLQKEVAKRPLGEIRGTQILPTRRWSAAMQMIYQNASLTDFQKLLRFYPDTESILQIAKDLPEVQEMMDCSDGDDRAKKRRLGPGDRATIVNVLKLLTDIKKQKND
ncbi:unnamed protein product [Durusdinium trenchii]|uniref:Fungal lipase-type domain-containing protein n=1 Tax=Durusdinium trenchii TaxID=1381693 RepID=A0ABP0RQU3_9DINO